RDALLRLADAAFRNRRKTLANNLKALGLTAEAARATLARAGIDPAARAETLDLPAWLRLLEAVEAAG
ncbi:MAG: 16S rRNA (adenine(1518)-N(6)/adenine(1519)-N(6))-dimethyltransferase, partial [Nitrospirae bacterium]